VKLYEAWGKHKEAAEWRRKLGVTDLPAAIFAEP
jgi:hypothetical protein